MVLKFLDNSMLLLLLLITFMQRIYNYTPKKMSVGYIQLQLLRDYYILVW